MLDLQQLSDRIADIQIAGRGIHDRRLLDAMRSVPREAFVDPGLEEFAYEDSPLPIDERQTISQPYIVAMMIDMAEIEPGDRVLEVGAGSGYAAAVLSRIASEVYAIEWRARPAAFALAAFCVLAAILFHANISDRNQLLHFEKDLDIAGGLLVLAIAGPGR